MHQSISHPDFSSEEVKFRLPVYYNDVAVCSLHIAVNQLALIRNDLETPVPESPDHFDPLPAPIAERFDPRKYRSDGLFLRHTGEPYDQAMPRLMFDKLRSDKNYIAHMMRCARDGFHRMNASFKVLEEMVFQNRELEQEEHLFIVEYVHNLMMLTRLKEHQHNLGVSIQRKMTVSQGFDETIMWNAMRLRFTRNWESARQAQQLAKCQALENQYRSELSKIRQLVDYETRCKNDAELYLLLKIDTMNQSSLRWMDRYDVDYESVEVDIQVAKEELEDLRKKRTALDAEYAKRQAVIDGFRKKRKEREDFEKNLVKFTRNALIIQCWWRAVMVQQGLGQFKRGKAKKGDKKKGDKKKGGKKK